TPYDRLCQASEPKPTALLPFDEATTVPFCEQRHLLESCWCPCIQVKISEYRDAEPLGARFCKTPLTRAWPRNSWRLWGQHRPPPLQIQQERAVFFGPPQKRYAPLGRQTKMSH